MSERPAPGDPAEAIRDAAGGASRRADLGHQAARGGMLVVGAQALKMVIQVAGVVVLARLLTPADYGLIAMVTAIIGVAEIFRDFGLSSAAIQAATLSRGQRDNLFWINTGAGVVLTILVIATAPMIALWYGRPELGAVATALSFVFVLNGIATQFRADLNRRLRFSWLAGTEIAASLLALGVAVGCAAYGLGYWALVVQQLTTAFILLLAVAVAGRWLPRLPTRQAPMRHLLSFGGSLASAQLLGYLGNNVDSLTIGTRFGAAPLGLYNRAFQLVMTPLGQLRTPTTSVALPVLARLKDDPVASNHYVQRGQLALGLTLVAGLGMVIGAAGPITAVFLGAQWLAVEPILRLLALAGIFQTLAYVGYWIYLAQGLTKALLQYTVITVTIKVSCILIGSLWGLIGVAWGFALAPALAWPLSFWWLSRHSPITMAPLLAGAARIIGLTALVAAASWAGCLVAGDANRWVGLAAGLGGGLVGYCLATLIVPGIRRDVRRIAAIARRGARRQARAA